MRSGSTGAGQLRARVVVTLRAGYGIDLHYTLHGSMGYCTHAPSSGAGKQITGWTKPLYFSEWDKSPFESEVLQNPLQPKEEMAVL